jgi:hypothetical protein
MDVGQFHPRSEFDEYNGWRGWFFNPFAWQFLFAIGIAAGALPSYTGTLPRSPRLEGRLLGLYRSRPAGRVAMGGCGISSRSLRPL